MFCVILPLLSDVMLLAHDTGKFARDKTLALPLCVSPVLGPSALFLLRATCVLVPSQGSDFVNLGRYSVPAENGGRYHRAQANGK